MNLSHRIRLDPTPEQVSYFRRACGTARFTYNWALAAWSCGMVLDRDLNAAFNLAALGLRVTACGEASSGHGNVVKLASVKQEPFTRAHLCAREG